MVLYRKIIMATEFISKIEKLLDYDPLNLTMVEDVFHEAMLENAVESINDDKKTNNNRVMPYVEEFLRNAVFLLELDSESDARFQLETAKAILLTTP